MEENIDNINKKEHKMETEDNLNHVVEGEGKNDKKEIRSDDLTSKNINKNKDIIDVNSTKLSTLLSTVGLNDNMKADVKFLLQEELTAATESLKKDVKIEARDLKKDFLTIFGIFASFVTFLSIEVQVFKNTSDVFELIGICSLSLSFVMFFAIMLNEIAKDKSELKNFKTPTYLINLVFLIIGIIFILLGSSKIENRMKSLEESKRTDSIYINNLNKKVEELKFEVLKSDISKFNIDYNKKDSTYKANHK